MSNANFIKGSIYGHMVGDAIGFPLKNIATLPKYLEMYGTSTFPKGTLTDASLMMLCTISSINDSRNISSEEIISNLQDWYLGGFLAVNEDCIEIKSNVMQSLTNYTNGFPPDRCGINEEKQNNNASLIRTLPVALFCANKGIDEFIENIHAIAQITNPQIDNQVCCVLYGLLIRNILLEKKEKVFELLQDYYKTKKQYKRNSALSSVFEWKDKNYPRGTDEVKDSFWSAWTAYAGNQADFRECLAKAVNYGNACDDTACLAGALVGVTLGFNSIPEEWINNLQLNFEAKDEIEKFIKLVQK